MILVNSIIIISLLLKTLLVGDTSCFVEISRSHNFTGNDNDDDFDDDGDFDDDDDFDDNKGRRVM